MTSNTSSLPEVVGDAALTVTPTATADLAQAIERLLGDEALRRDLAARGQKRAASFTWRRAAEKTREVYESVLSAR